MIAWLIWKIIGIAIVVGVISVLFATGKLNPQQFVTLGNKIIAGIKKAFAFVKKIFKKK